MGSTDTRQLAQTPASHDSFLLHNKWFRDPEFFTAGSLGSVFNFVLPFLKNTSVEVSINMVEDST